MPPFGAMAPAKQPTYPIKLVKSGLASPDVQSTIAEATTETQSGIRRYLDAVRSNRIAVLSQ